MTVLLSGIRALGEPFIEPAGRSFHVSSLWLAAITQSGE
jgi:hypothetical protein